MFGSLCFASSIPIHRNKFDSRSRQCVFIGYRLDIKGYKLYDLESKTIFVSRDVQFHETIFPFRSPSSLPPLPNFVLPEFFSFDLAHDPSNSASSSSLSHPISVNVPLSPSIPSISNDSSPIPIIPTQKSSRHIQLPSYLQDYHHSLRDTSLPSSTVCSTSHPIQHYLSYAHLSPIHKYFTICFISFGAYFLFSSYPI